jgi:exodeoxyribonuclease VII large subunit
MPVPLPEKAADTTAEHPWPVRVLSLKISDYVDRMSQLWVEGQVVQFTPRGGTAFLTLRDPDVDMSLSVSVPMNAVNAMPVPLTQGARVVLQAKPTFWTKRGTLQLEARQIRPVGIGDLLARVEILKRTLAAEGVFDTERKRPIPFLPNRVGLITGRSSAAERDVVENARRRWPAVRFEIREVAVQGVTAVTEVVEALRELDADPEVDVIVIARGGGALEELLPFSNEAMIRAVAAARTPVISAIGHDVDQPLLDLVADWRASTPTDAGKKVVPDADREHGLVDGARERLRRAVARRVEAERSGLRSLLTRPVMADPVSLVRARRQEVSALRARASARVEARLHRAADEAEHLRRQVVALSPQSTLERGYAVVQHRDGRVVMDREDVGVGELLRVRVARGDFGVRPVSPGIGEELDSR